MQFTTFSIATLAVIASSVIATDSSSFAITNTHSGTKYHDTNWGFDSKNNVVIPSVSKNGSKFKSLGIQDNKSVKTSDGKYFVVNSDHSISLGDANKATTGFSIGSKEGSPAPLNYNGEHGYYTCPNSDGDYVIYTQKPSSYSDKKCSTISSWAA